MRVFILGLNHQIQSRQILNASTDGKAETFEQDQKERFRCMLQQLIDQHSIQFVGEEARHSEESIAQVVCERAGCRYLNIEMEPQERTLRNIPPGYNEDPNVPQVQKTAWNQARERFMVEKIIAESRDADSVLVICGREHKGALGERFGQLGHTIGISDLEDESWYVEDWVGYIWHNL